MMVLTFFVELEVDILKELLLDLRFAVVGVFVLFADFISEVGVQELIEQIEIRVVFGGVLTRSESNDLLGEQVGLDSPIFAQLHDEVFDEILVVVKQL